MASGELLGELEYGHQLGAPLAVLTSNAAVEVGVEGEAGGFDDSGRRSRRSGTFAPAS